MKYAEEIAAEVCRKLGLPVFGVELSLSAAYQTIFQALQAHGQDRECAMRHACAEAVAAIPFTDLNYPDMHIACHAACMNAKIDQS